MACRPVGSRKTFWSVGEEGGGSEEDGALGKSMYSGEEGWDRSILIKRGADAGDGGAKARRRILEQHFSVISEEGRSNLR